MIDTKPLEVTDFSQGITDYFIDGQPGQAERMDNLILDPNRKALTRWGSILFNDNQLPLGVFRVNHILFYEERLLSFQQRRAYFIDAGNWSELLGPAGDAVFPLGNANSIISSALWQGHIFLANDSYGSIQKIYEDDLGVFQVRNAGLPSMPAGTAVAVPPGAGANYLYSFVLRYSYKAKTLTFLDRGPVLTFPTVVTGGTITTGNGALVTLPTALVDVENWDIANIEIEIYRTIDAGDTYFLVTSVALGTVNYNDETEDGSLQNNQSLYTSAGISDNGTPPKSKFVHVVNNTGYYAEVLNGTENDRRIVYQSIPGDPDSVPPSFFAETEQDIKGLSSIYDRPMVFCDEYVYRADNIINSFGVGGMLLRRIDDRAGCVSTNSIVRTHEGIFWAGREGFYWSDGFKVKNISLHLNETYKKIVLNQTRKERIVGTYDPGNKRVYWSVCIEDGANEPDRWFICDLKFGVQVSSSFTTASNGEFFRPTAIHFKDTTLYRGDTRGFVLQHSSNLFTDPKIDTGVTPSNWEILAVIHDYKSAFMDFGTKFYRKFVSRILVTAGNLTNLSLAINSSNDNNRVTSALKPIRYKNNITWGDQLPLWGDPEALWNIQGLIEEVRRFPAGGLRCNYKQVQFTNAVVQIVTSSLLGTCTVSQAAKTATLGGSFTWLDDVVDYFISFEDDDFGTQFLITARTSTTLTFEDTTSEAPVDGVYNWVLRGVPKGEVLQLNGYVIHWQYISKSHTPFSAGSLGSNP